MIRDYFVAKESLSAGARIDFAEFLSQLAFNDQGLLPVITQEQSSGQVLMFAWMNRDAVLKTLETQQMTYWSRSRKQLWHKGETSGSIQHLKRMQFDCDGDVILCQVDQLGAACHTGRKHCFYFDVDDEQGNIVINSSIPE